VDDTHTIRVPEAPQAAGLAERIVCEHGTRHRALAVRVGMHTGTAVTRGDDWFGAAVNLAARVADVAGPGEVICTEATRACVGPAVPLRERGSTAFKNVSEPVILYEFVLEGRTGPALPVDPVCHTAVDPEHAAQQLTHASVTDYFCSDRCAAVWRPE
jgi:class 3 adenylate cyclase/YHS domain-containing protein